MADIFQSIAILCVAITGVALTLYYRGLRDRVDVIQEVDELCQRAVIDPELLRGARELS